MAFWGTGGGCLVDNLLGKSYNKSKKDSPVHYICGRYIEGVLQMSGSGNKTKVSLDRVKMDTWFVGLFANPSIKRAGRAKMGVKRGSRRTKKSEKIKKRTANDQKRRVF